MTPWVVGTAVGLLARTWRLREDGREHLDAARAAGPVLFAPWHEALMPLVWHHREQGITLLVGRHADAALLARTAARWGYRLARGSSSRGGAAAYRALVRDLRAGRDGAVTPDGPRGPRRVAKPGVIRAARAAGATIVPVMARADRAWRLHSWDRMLVPAPGAAVTVCYGPGLAPGTDTADLADALHELAPA